MGEGTKANHWYCHRSYLAGPEFHLRDHHGIYFCRLYREGNSRSFSILVDSWAQYCGFLCISRGVPCFPSRADACCTDPPKTAEGISMIPFERDIKFVERSDVFRNIIHMYRTHGRVALSGIGGVG